MHIDGFGPALLYAWVTVDPQQMSGSALSDNDSLSSHVLPDPPEDISPSTSAYSYLYLQLSVCFLHLFLYFILLTSVLLRK